MILQRIIEAPARGALNIFGASCSARTGKVVLLLCLQTRHLSVARCRLQQKTAKSSSREPEEPRKPAAQMIFWLFSDLAWRFLTTTTAFICRERPIVFVLTQVSDGRCNCCGYATKLAEGGRGERAPGALVCIKVSNLGTKLPLEDEAGFGVSSCRSSRDSRRKRFAQPTAPCQW